MRGGRATSKAQWVRTTVDSCRAPAWSGQSGVRRARPPSPHPAAPAPRCDALAAVGLDVANSEAQLRACEFLLSKQCADGGWGESYLSCQDKARPGPPFVPTLTPKHHSRVSMEEWAGTQRGMQVHALQCQAAGMLRCELHTRAWSLARGATPSRDAAAVRWQCSAPC